MPQARSWKLETEDYCGRVALASPTESAARRCAITARDKQLSGDSSHQQPATSAAAAVAAAAATSVGAAATINWQHAINGSPAGGGESGDAAGGDLDFKNYLCRSKDRKYPDFRNR